MSHHATSLFDLPLPSARNDPPSSAASAREIVASGQRDRNIMKVATLVASMPGRTTAELANTSAAKRFGLSRHEIARRASEAEAAGLIRRGAMRKCTANHRLALTWFDVGAGNPECESDA